MQHIGMTIGNRTPTLIDTGILTPWNLQTEAKLQIAELEFILGVRETTHQPHFSMR